MARSAIAIALASEPAASKPSAGGLSAATAALRRRMPKAIAPNAAGVRLPIMGAARAVTAGFAV
jgi:hypothetical protein